MNREALRMRLQHKPTGYAYPVGRVAAIYAGLMVIVLMATLDQTIVATALPRIDSDLGGLSDYSLIFTSFLLCQTVTVPIYGKLGDIFGRRPLVLIAIAVFLTGSALCGAAQSLLQLVIFRGLQGVGAGGLMPLAVATVADLIPPRDRGRFQALFSSMVATSAALGPAAGGLIVDNATWRWIFYINLPIGAVAAGVVWLSMPRRSVRHAHSVDYAGAALFALGAGAVLLGLVWGGGAHPWASPWVVSMLVAGVVAFVLFAFVERRAAEPIIPFEVLRVPNVLVGSLGTFLGATCFFGSIAFVPLFVQGVIGKSATSSAFAITPLMLGVVVGAITAGQWVTRTGHYRLNLLLGPLILATGMFLLARLGPSATTYEVARDMAVCGWGLGFMNNTFIVISQNAVAARVVGSATSLVQFSRAIGTTVGVTLFGTIINQQLPPGILADGRLVHQLDRAGRATLANAFRPAFVVAIALALAIFIAVVLGIEEQPLRRSVEGASTGD